MSDSGMMLAITPAAVRRQNQQRQQLRQQLLLKLRQRQRRKRLRIELTLADGQMFSYLTGRPVDKKIGLQRLCDHDQQYQRRTSSVGVSQAEMIYRGAGGRRNYPFDGIVPGCGSC